MKIQTIRPVRSLFPSDFIKPSRNKTRRGLTRFESPLKNTAGENAEYDPRSRSYNPLSGKVEVVQNKRVAVVRNKGKAGFHAIGFGPFKGTFADFKPALKAAGYTHTKFIGQIKPIE
jgi:hypothetical protein